jgi:hypothetical protein
MGLLMKMTVYGANTAKKTAVYDHRTLAVNTPYIIRHKYGRKTSTWITAKYGMYTTRIRLYTAVKKPYSYRIRAVYGDRNQPPGCKSFSTISHTCEAHYYYNIIHLVANIFLIPLLNGYHFPQIVMP